MRSVFCEICDFARDLSCTYRAKFFREAKKCKICDFAHKFYKNLPKGAWFLKMVYHQTFFAAGEKRKICDFAL